MRLIVLLHQAQVGPLFVCPQDSPHSVLQSRTHHPLAVNPALMDLSKRVRSPSFRELLAHPSCAECRLRIPFSHPRDRCPATNRLSCLLVATSLLCVPFLPLLVQ